MASGDKDRDTKDALFKLLQMGTVTEYETVDTIVGDQEDPDVKGKQEVKKADDREIENIKDEEGKNVKYQQVSEQTINETADTITSLQSEVASLEAKGSLDANKEIKETRTRVHELEKQIFV
ncbi:hypothetical protein Tco_0718599 [Tanacetum coccineum]